MFFFSFTLLLPPDFSSSFTFFFRSSFFPSFVSSLFFASFFSAELSSFLSLSLDLELSGDFDRAALAGLLRSFLVSSFEVLSSSLALPPLSAFLADSLFESFFFDSSFASSLFWSFSPLCLGSGLVDEDVPSLSLDRPRCEVPLLRPPTLRPDFLVEELRRRGGVRERDRVRFPLSGERERERDLDRRLRGGVGLRRLRGGLGERRRRGGDLERLLGGVREREDLLRLREGLLLLLLRGDGERR
mmetsp:Transcript_22857/g.31828  ORF Transcript_22857/g.31828 Transcript_22857/m.31828 type:complete len:244 (-) Transcript_22857:4-735(-)